MFTEYSNGHIVQINGL